MTTLARENGVALLVAMMALLLMSALGTVLILTSTSETLIAAHFRDNFEARYAAGAALERGIDDIGAVADWTLLTGGWLQSSWVDGSPPGARRMPWLGGLALLLFLLLWRSTNIDDAGWGTTLGQIFVRGDGAAVLGAFVSGTYFFACITRPGSVSLAWLRTAALQSLGTISYSFYLCHPLVMFAVKRVVILAVPDARGSWLATGVFTLAAAALSWLLAWLCWRWFEQGLSRWLRHREREFTRSRAALAR